MPAHLFEDEAVGLAEARERAGARADVADLDDARLSARGVRAEHRGHGDCGGAGLSPACGGESSVVHA